MRESRCERAPALVRIRSGQAWHNPVETYPRRYVRHRHPRKTSARVGTCTCRAGLAATPASNRTARGVLPTPLSRLYRRDQNPYSSSIFLTGSGRKVAVRAIIRGAASALGRLHFYEGPNNPRHGAVATPRLRRPQRTVLMVTYCAPPTADETPIWTCSDRCASKFARRGRCRAAGTGVAHPRPPGRAPTIAAPRTTLPTGPRSRSPACTRNRGRYHNETPASRCPRCTDGFNIVRGPPPCRRGGSAGLRAHATQRPAPPPAAAASHAITRAPDAPIRPPRPRWSKRGRRCAGRTRAA